MDTFRIDFLYSSKPWWPRWIVELCAPWWIVPFTKARTVRNPLHNLDVVACFYHNATGDRCTDWKMTGALVNFINHYAQTQLGKTGLEFVENTSDNPHRFDDVKTWAQQKYNIKFNEVMEDGTVLLEAPSSKEMIAAEKSLRDAIDDANRFPSRARQVILQGTQQALDDLRDRPRYETTRVKHYIEIAYYDHPELTKSEIRKKLIEDWNPQGLR